jgi:hypothetical protein
LLISRKKIKREGSFLFSFAAVPHFFIAAVSLSPPPLSVSDVFAFPLSFSSLLSLNPLLSLYSFSSSLRRAWSCPRTRPRRRKKKL